MRRSDAVIGFGGLWKPAGQRTNRSAESPSFPRNATLARPSGPVADTSLPSRTTEAPGSGIPGSLSTWSTISKGAAPEFGDEQPIEVQIKLQNEVKRPIAAPKTNKGRISFKVRGAPI